MADEIRGYPVYIVPDQNFQIHDPDIVRSFPFEVGGLVEMKSTLIYHEINAWVKKEILSQAKWSASLYPAGEVLSPDTLMVNLRDINNVEKTFKFEWPVDHHTRLIIVSDSPVPPELFESPKSGDAISVRLTLKVVKTGSSEEGIDQTPIILKPVGELNEGLILSEVRR